MKFGRFLIALLAGVTLVSFGCSGQAPAPFKPGPGATNTAVNYFSRFSAFGVGPGATYSLNQMEELAVAMIGDAQRTIDAALGEFESEAIADALIEAAARGVEVRVVADTDRLGQRGFRRLIEAQSDGIDLVDGDGEVEWKPIFDKDPVIRAGDDNLMIHHFVIVDRYRILNLSAGFPPDGPSILQTGFMAASEDICEDFTNAFDQLHGGVFSTTQTFFNDSVSSDSNNRTMYPVEDGVIEIYFGPQERLVKDVVDRIYNAKSSVFIASEMYENDEVARALRYKFSATNAAGERLFDIRLLLGQAPTAEVGDIPVQRSANIRGSLIIIDGQISAIENAMARRERRAAVTSMGSAIVLSLPLFEAAPFRLKGDGQPEAQRSDRFADSNMWVVQQNLVRPNEDYTQLADTFETLWASSAASGGDGGAQ